MSYVEYVVEKSGLGKVVYFLATKEEGDGWVTGFFPAYMAPDPDDEAEADMFDIANPDHTVVGPTKEASRESMRAWIEETYKGRIHDRRERRVPLR